MDEILDADEVAVLEREALAAEEESDIESLLARIGNCRRTASSEA